MKVAGIREIKNKLSEYLRLVGAGEDVLITDHGEVVAELKKPDKRIWGDLPVGLMKMIREGRISMGGKNRSNLYPFMKLLLPRGLSAKMLSEEREED